MDATAADGIFSAFIRDVPDPRTGNFIAHRLHDLIVIAVLAVISEADGWAQVAFWGQRKAKWLRTFSDLPDVRGTSGPEPDIESSIMADRTIPPMECCRTPAATS